MTTATVENPERAKYQRMWDVPDYRAIAPGEHWALRFLAQARVEKDAEIIDFGCGTGRGGLQLALFGAMKVTLLDFTDNCLDPEVAQACVTQPTRIKFVQADLTKTMNVSAAYGYCCDVMEHIPTEDVDKVLDNILSSAHHCFFAISTVDDVMGAEIGEPLHLTVKPTAWWAEKLRNHGAVIHWSCDYFEDCCAFYCTSWKDANDLLAGGVVNTKESDLDAQVAENIKAGWTNIHPYNRQDREVVLLAGGPTMNEKAQVDEIRRLREEEHVCLITVNGAYQWAIDKGLSISAQIVLDARAFNARFTRPILDKCVYLIASQVHPSTLEGLPKDRTYLWHSGISEANAKLAHEVAGNYFPIPGGSTVVLRALPLLRLMGYWRIHLFGADSCVMNGAHHAYEQVENNGEPTVPVTCGGRTFQCVPWMLSQASEFRDLVKFLGDEVELALYGHGLLHHMIQTGASFSTKE